MNTREKIAAIPCKPFRAKGGVGIDGCIQACCEFGWKGQKNYAWGSRQHYQTDEDAKRHKAQQANKGFRDAE